MADNLAVTPGTGATIGMDEVTDGTLGTVKVAFGKIMDGTIDGTNKLAITSGGAAKVDGSATTQPVSAASLPLPTGAATAAKQPALGTAGTASSDVITVQGITSMTPLKTDGSGVTQPVSGTVTANAGTNLNTSALALETGGNLATIATNTASNATSANQTNGSQQTKITDGTNIASVVGGDSGFNGLAVSSGTKTFTFTTSSSGAQTVLANTNVEGYSWVEVVYTSVGSGLALTGQFSTASGGTYVNSSSFGTPGGSPSAPLGVAVNTLYSSPIHGNYFQIAVSALTSGTFAGTVTLRVMPPTQTSSTIFQGGALSVGSSSATGSAIPANAFFVGLNDGTNLVGWKDAIAASDSNSGLGIGSILPSLYNGSTYDKARSGGVTGMAGVSMQASPSGGYSFAHIAAGQATTTVKSGAGTLHAIVFNGAATATNVTTIYDNTAGSGTVIGIPAATAVTTPESVVYDLAFSTGLTIVTATANGSDMTVIYK